MMKKIIISSLVAAPSLLNAGLVPMADQELQTVNAQAGITLETSSHLTVGDVTYTEDANRLQLQNIERGSQADISMPSSSKQVVDVLADGSLQRNSEVYPTSLAIGAIRINDSAASFGQFRLNYSGTNIIKVGASSSLDNFLEGSFQTSISDAELIWTTNGSSVSFDDIGYNANITRLAIGEAVDGSRTGLNFDLDEFSYSFSTGGVKLGGVSLGTLAGQLALSGDAQIFAG